MPILTIVLSSGAVARLNVLAGSTDPVPYIRGILREAAALAARSGAVANQSALASLAADAAESSARADFGST